MLDFEEELKKFKPSLEGEDIEDAVYQEEMTDVMDLLNKVMDQQKNQKDQKTDQEDFEDRMCCMGFYCKTSGNACDAADHFSVGADNTNA